MKAKPVKIVATLGPSTSSEKVIKELAETGVDVFRINFSHAAPEDVPVIAHWIRSVEKKINKPLTIMLDLPGPKIRITDMEANVILKKGQKFTIEKGVTKGNEHKCGLNQPDIINILEPGAEVYIDEGAIKLVITGKTENSLDTTVLIGGELKPKKGFSAEGMFLAKAGITERDEIGIKLAIEHRLDAMAISFVQNEQDVIEVKKRLPEGSKIMLVAKIETAEGVRNAEAILGEVDCMMIARGDLGLAVPLAQVPYIQKDLISLCVRKTKPVITATQMMESMITKPVPTRAEVADLANAILDYTDAVMLSAETATGKYPIETVGTMVKVIQESRDHLKPFEFEEKNTMNIATSSSVGTIADRVGAKLIIAFTHSGATAKRIARHRHNQSILAVSPDAAIMRRLNFSWGVHPIKIEQTRDFEDMLAQARELAKNNQIEPLVEGDYYVISAGMPFG
ncbi:MAG: pyruvate kinase, partial [Candidatus Levyibacteriota bacterium]